MTENTDDWKEAGSSGDSITWDKEGTLVGTYVRMKTKVGPNESNVYELNTVDPKTKEEQVYSIWGSTVLDTKFEAIPVGSLVKVEALGKVASPKTGREYNDFKVLYKENPIADVIPGSTVVENEE